MNELLDYGDRAITRPPRARYDLESIPNELEIANYGKIRRHPVKFPNSRGFTIIGSYYGPNETQEEPSCLIYLHGNASCQLEGTYLIPFLVPHGISVFCFDFSACGKSAGKRITLGYLEKDDVSCAITYMQVHFGIKKFVLWGRSMGAACVFYSIPYNPEIVGAVADSPFASLPILVKDLSAEMGVPRCFSGITMRLLANKIIQSSGFDIRECLPVEEAKVSTTPVFIIHGKEDDFILVKHASQLYEAYKGQNKRLVVIPGQNHNSDRPNQVTSEAIQFIGNCLGKMIPPETITAQIGAGALHFAGLDEMITNMDDDD